MISSRVKGRFKGRLLFALALSLSLGLLGACGKKPAQVDPPAGVAREVYTREYPDLRADPAP